MIPGWRNRTLREKLAYHVQVFWPEVRSNPVLALLRHDGTWLLLEPLLFRLPWLILGVFVARAFMGPPPAYILQFPATAVVALLYFICCLVCEVLRCREGGRRLHFPDPRTARTLLIIDCLFLTAYYVATKHPESSVTFMFFLPIVRGAQYMPLRANLFPLWAVSLTFAIGVACVLVVSQTHHNVDWSSAAAFAESFVRICSPRLGMFWIVGLFFCWTVINLHCLQEMVRACFENSPDGMTFISQRSSDPAKDMRVLHMNSAQLRFAPQAQKNRHSCRREFGAIQTTDEPCPSCPVVDVLDGTTSFSRSVTASYVGDDALGYFDVSAAPMCDEARAPIAAVEMVKEVTAQVELAQLAHRLLDNLDRQEILLTAVSAFRDMFRLREALYVEVRNNRAMVTAATRATCRRGATPFLVDEPGRSVAADVWSALADGLLSPDAEINPVLLQRRWNHRLLRGSGSLQRFADQFGVDSGLLMPVRLLDDASTIGVLLGTARKDQEFTALEVNAAASAADFVALALKRSVTSAGHQQESASARDMYALMCNAATKRDPEHLIGMCLLAATHGYGLGFSRAVYLDVINGSLAFRMGIGPLNQAEASWPESREALPSMIDQFRAPQFLYQLRTSSMTTVGKDMQPLSLAKLENSAIQYCANASQTVLGQKDDPFTMTPLAKALQFNGGFVASPVHNRGKMLGLVIADKSYLESAAAEVPELMPFLTTVTGIMLANAGHGFQECEIV